jgi:hypothetical protein
MYATEAKWRVWYVSQGIHVCFFFVTMALFEIQDPTDRNSTGKVRVGKEGFYKTFSLFGAQSQQELILLSQQRQK